MKTLTKTEIAAYAHFADATYLREYEDTKKYTRLIFDDNFKSGFKYALYQNKDNPKEIILAFAGTDIDFRKHGFKDHKNDLQMALSFLPEQFADALNTYRTVANGLSKDIKITIVGHSLGGSLAQLVCAVTGEIGVTFNPYGVRNILKDKFISKFIGNPKSNFKNIINYKTSNDVLYNIAEFKSAKNNLGTTYIVEDHKNPIASHSNFNDIILGKKIPAEEYERQRDRVSNYISEAEKKFRSLHPMFEKTNILKNGKPLTSAEWESFTEGFLSNKIGNPEKRIYENKKTTSNGDDLERGPNGELGHWYTNKGGGHYFVPVA